MAAQGANTALRKETGTQDSLKIATYVHGALTEVGMNDQQAWAYAVFCQEMYNAIQSDPQLQSALKLFKLGKDTKEVYEGSEKVVKAENYLKNAAEVGLSSANRGFRNYRGAGAAGVLSVFVDRFEALAKYQGIELNECSLAVSKVALDIAAGGAGVLTALTPVGWVLVALAAVSTFKDSYALGAACFTAQ